MFLDGASWFWNTSKVSSLHNNFRNQGTLKLTLFRTIFPESDRNGYPPIKNFWMGQTSSGTLAKFRGYTTTYSGPGTAKGSSCGRISSDPSGNGDPTYRIADTYSC